MNHILQQGKSNLKGVDEKYYIPDEKAKTIIAQALEKLETLGKVHACITPERLKKRQNGPRAKEEEEPMFTLTAQDLHGVIIREDENADLGGGVMRKRDMERMHRFFLLPRVPRQGWRLPGMAIASIFHIQQALHAGEE